jgi:hypothetical protein
VPHVLLKFVVCVNSTDETEVGCFLKQVEVAKQTVSDLFFTKRKQFSSLLYPLPLFSARFLQPLSAPNRAPLLLATIDHAERKLLIKDLCSLKIRETYSYCRSLVFRLSLKTKEALLFMYIQFLHPFKFLFGLNI